MRPWSKEYYENVGSVVEGVIEIISAKRARNYGQPSWMITSRLKSDESITAKLRRKCNVRPEYSVASMTDLVGVRVIVESVACAKRLAQFIREHDLFAVREGDSEDFVDRPRADGYRGIHIILDVKSALPGKPILPVELQIRTILQHQWSELSHSEFYKSLSDIPEGLLVRMRALSEILNCAEIESDQLRRGRVLDDCRIDVRDLLREKVLEYLKGADESKNADLIGRAAIALVEFEGQLRRCLVSEGDAQERAFEALLALGDEVKELMPSLGNTIERVRRRIEIIVKVIPENWAQQGQQQL